MLFSIVFELTGADVWHTLDTENAFNKTYKMTDISCNFNSSITNKTNERVAFDYLWDTLSLTTTTTVGQSQYLSFTAAFPSSEDLEYIYLKAKNSQGGIVLTTWSKETDLFI